MTTLSPLLLAALLPIAAGGTSPLTVAGRVVGTDDRPAGRVEVLVSGLGGVDGTLPILARTRTGADGYFRVTVPAEEDPNRGNALLAVWAHRPGEGIGAVGVSRQKPPADGSVAVKLGPQAHLAVRVIGPRGEPIKGAVVSPRMMRIDGGLPPSSSFPLPDELTARLSARTDAKREGRMADVDPAAVQAVQVEAPAFGRQGASPSADGDGMMTITLAAVGRVTGIVVALVAERWIDLGDEARGEALLRANLADAEKMPNAAFAGYARAVFAEELAQVDLKAALALTATLTDPREFDRHHGNIAHELAARDPAEAERVLGLVRDPFQRDQYAVRVVYRMARADLARARRLAGAINDTSLRGYGLGMVAIGLAEADKRAEAAALLDEAFALLERASEAAEGQTSRMYSPAAVAAVLIPVAERTDPRLVPGSFWRALSFRTPKISSPPDFDPGAITDVQLAVMLARYDRAVARSLLDPLVGPDGPASVRVGARGLPYAAAAVIDPHWASGLVEALPDDADLKAHQPKNSTRMAVAKVLSRRGVNRWRYLTYQYMHLWVPDIEDIDPNL